MDNTQENRLSFKLDCEYSGLDDTKSRRSSILKPPKARAPLLDVNFSNKKDNEDFEANRKRRVSFAGVNKVKEFNSQVGTIHVSNTPCYDELFSSSSDSSGMLQSGSGGYLTQAEDAKIEKEANLILNIISRDDSLFLNESMDITDCSSNGSDAKLQGTSLSNNESNDNIEIDVKNTSSFNPQILDYLNENQDETKCLSETSNESIPHIIEGMDLTQPMLSDKMQESVTDMSLEPNLMTEMHISSDVIADNNGIKKTCDENTASGDSQLPLNILQNLISSSEVAEYIHKPGVENSSKEIPKQVEVIYEQPSKKTGVENISSHNKQFTEPYFKLAQETCKVIPLNHPEMDSDLNNSIDMEFTEAVDRIEGIQTNLMEKQKTVADIGKRVSRKSMINTFNVNTLNDSSKMELTDACILEQVENSSCGKTLCTNLPSSENSGNMEFVEKGCILKSSAKMSKADDLPIVQDNDCSFNIAQLRLTGAYSMKSTEINFPFNNVFKSEGSTQKQSVKSDKENPSEITNCSSNINPQVHDCSMEVTETCVNKPAGYVKANIFKEAPENECSSTMEFTKANVEFSKEKENHKSVSIPNEVLSSDMEIAENCSIKPSENVMGARNTEKILVNETSSNMKFTDAYLAKPICKFKNDGFKNILHSENDLVRNTESHQVMASEDRHSLTKDRELNCSMEFTEVCIPKPCEKSIIFFRNNERNLNITSSMEFTEACVINSAAVSTDSVPLKKNHESSSNMEFTDACKINPSNVAKNTLPFMKDNKLSDMEFTEAYVANPPNGSRNPLSFKKSHEFSSNMELTEACEAIPSDITRNDLPFTKDRELSNMELTEAYVEKPPDIINCALPLTKSRELSSNMEFTEVHLAKSPEVTKNYLPITKSCHLPSDVEAYVAKPPNEPSEGSLPFGKSRELSSNMEFTEACIINAPSIFRNSLPSMNVCEFSLTRKLTKASPAYPPDVTRNSFPFTKNHECSSSMEFTNILNRCDTKQRNSRVDINEISSHKENEKNGVNELNNKNNFSKSVTVSEHHSSRPENPFDLMHEKSLLDTSAGMELTTSLHEIDADAETASSSKISNVGSEGFGRRLMNNSASVCAFMDPLQKSAANSISLKIDDIPSTAKADKNEESNLINFGRSISHLEEIGDCDFADTSTEYVSTDIKKGLDSVGINFSSNEQKESDNQTIDITYSGKLENNDNVLPTDKNGGQKNITETLDNSENDELDNEKQLLLKESVNLDMTYRCNLQPSNGKVGSNESFTIRSKAKINERNSQADIEENRSTKKAKIDGESSNKNLYEASKVNTEIVQSQEQVQIERSSFTSVGACESQKLHETIEHDSDVKKNCSNSIPPIFEEQYNEIRSKNISEDIANKLEEISDKEMKNTSKENEITSPYLHVQQAVQPSDLPNFPVAHILAARQEDCFHVYDVKNAGQCNLAETVENGSAQNHHLNYTSSKSISDNTTTLVNTDLNNSQTQQNNCEIIEVGGKILSPEPCEKLNLSIGVADDLCTKEEISVSHRDKTGFMSNSDRISQPAMEAGKNIEGKTVMNAINAKDNIHAANENEAKPSELSTNHISKDNKIVSKSMQVGPAFSSLGNSLKKTKTTWEGTLEKEGASISSSYLQSVEYRKNMEQYKLNVQNLKFMSDLGFSRKSFTYWRYNLTETLSIVFNVPNGRIDESTCLKSVNYNVNKHSDTINLYISEVIKKRYTEEWLKSECRTVKDVLQISDIIMKERLEIKKFYKTVNYMYRFYPCKFNNNRISFNIVDIKACLKFDVVIHIDGWKKIKAEDIKVVSIIGNFREHLVRRLFTTIPDDEKKLINFVRMLEDYCKSLNNAAL